jgi:hypothetical protein
MARDKFTASALGTVPSLRSINTCQYPVLLTGKLNGLITTDVVLYSRVTQIANLKIQRQLFEVLLIIEYIQGKVISVTGREDLQDCETSRFSHFL